MTADPTTLPLHGLAAAYRNGRLRPTAVVEAYLERIQAGAVYRVVTATRARHQARRAERLFAEGVDQGPLQGVPIALKDMMDTAGEVTAAGSAMLAEGPPAPADCPAAARLDAAGAVFLGKTGMTELAFGGLGMNPHYGTPGCALDPDRVPGGSSSGSAVAVAAGLACAAVGSDTGGSVRIPAAFNGIVGLKTTDGAIPMAGCVPLSPTLDTLGPLTRSVPDAWHLWRALAALPPAPFPDAPLDRLSLLVPEELVEDLDAEVERVFGEACERLAARGHRIERRSVPMLTEIPALYERHGTFAGLEGWVLHRGLLERALDRIDPRVSTRLLANSDRTAADHARLLEARDRIRADFEALVRRYDALVSPTVPVLPPRLGDVATETSYLDANARVLRNTQVFNFVGRPAVTVPGGTTDAGLSVGLMIVTEPGGEEPALRIALAVDGGEPGRTASAGR